MRRSFLKQALVVLASCALSFPIAIDCFVTAQAATITISDQNCDSFTLTGSPPNQSLACVVSTAPSCTVTGPSVGQTNNPITLTASCSPAATGWVWTGGNCAASVTSTCQDTQTVVGAVNYTVKGSNAIGPGNVSPQFQVTWSNSPPAVPTGCSISGAPGGNQTAGVQVTLTISCTGGGQPNAWTWTGTGAAGQNASTVGPMAVNTTTTFTAKASADGGTTFSSAAQATVTIGGGGGGGGPIVCQGYNSTIVLELGYLSQSSGLSEGFGPNDALVAHFKTSGAAASTAGKLGQIYAVEFGTGTAPRKGSLSTVPCDFTAGFAEKKCSGSLTAFDGDPGPSFGLTQGTTVAACTADLAPNTDYYFNVNNHPTLGGGCTAASCDMKVNLQKPGGT